MLWAAAQKKIKRIRRCHFAEGKGHTLSWCLPSFMVIALVSLHL